MICFQVPKIPEQYLSQIVDHVVEVHTGVASYTVEFMVKLRRKNYLTPKHYLDFISVYLVLLEEKNNFILAQVSFKIILVTIWILQKQYDQYRTN